MTKNKRQDPHLDVRMSFHLRHEIGQMILIFGILVFVVGAVMRIAIDRGSAVHLSPRPLPFAHHLLKLVRTRLYRLVIITIRLHVLLPKRLRRWGRENDGRGNEVEALGRD